MDQEVFYFLIRHTEQHQCLLYDPKNVELQCTRLYIISLATVKVGNESNSDRIKNIQISSFLAYTLFYENQSMFDFKEPYFWHV